MTATDVNGPGTGTGAITLGGMTMGEWRASRSQRGRRVVRAMRGLVSRLRQVGREIGKFGVVGAAGFVVNVLVFNLCIDTFALAPIRSGVISQVIAIGTNYLGNRYWTYLDTDKHRVRRETLLFFLFSGIGLVLENSVLAISHYGLGYTSSLADNISKNGIGLLIGTVFRFWSYRTWVFKAVPGGASAGVVASGGGRRRGRRGASKEEGEDGRMLL
jgi:putative flippase GtrA